MFAQPEFWVLVAFFLFLALALRPAIRVVTTALDARADKIRDEIESAAKLREDAQSALANFQRKQREAVKEAEDIVARARTETERLRQAATATLEETLARREAMALERIDQAEAQAIDELRARAVELALAATNSLILDHLDSTTKDAAIQDSIAALSDKLG